MSLFCKHKWKTMKRSSKPIYEPVPYGVWQYSTPKPINHKWVVYQQCTKCGKEVIRSKF